MNRSLKNIKRILYSGLAILLTAGIILSANSFLKADAAFIDSFNEDQSNKSLMFLSMNTARALALEESTAYFSIQNTIETKQANLESSIKKIKLKQKKMSTLSWSPLLNFKLPTKPNEAEAHEFQFTPVSIQNEIDKAEHNLIDTKLGIYEEINNLYVEIVFLQKKIAFEEQRCEAYEDALKRNRARLLTGDATQADVDALDKKLEAAKNTIAADQRTLTADLDKLSTKIGMDVTTQTRFEKPFVESSIPRSVLDALIEYTVDKDQQLYEASLDEVAAKKSLSINYQLMSSKFGRDIGMISGYVVQALQGIEIKGSIQRAFKNDYKNFLTKIDSYWAGKKRIIFIKVPKLWFKGSLDGTRYIDDDPNVLYEDVLNYSAARVERDKVEEDLIQSVKDEFENYISIRNTYITAMDDLEKAEEALNADFIRNQIGELSFEEYDSQASDYEELQNDFMETLKMYTQTLYSFDRLTCGGVSAYLSGTDSSLSAGESGTSHVEKEMAEGAMYFIKQIIQNEAFELSIYIPDDLEVDVTHFELWVDNVQIGERTDIKKSLRHVAVAKNALKEVKIRLYNDEEFVDDVKIDPSDVEGPLPIVAGRNIVKTSSDEIGKYDVEIDDVTALMTIGITVTEDNEVAFYRVEYGDGIVISGDEPIENKGEFKHLAIIEDGLDDLVIVLMNSEKQDMYKAKFVTTTRKIKKIE